MKSKRVAENLVLDEVMYDAAREALATYAPEQVHDFTWERFTKRESWMLIPDPENPDVLWYKAEMTVKIGPPYLQTVKLNVWWSADKRRDGAPWPHSHPWPFTGHVLTGGYVEERYTVERSFGVLADPYAQHEVGVVRVERDVRHVADTDTSDNLIGLDEFHEVRDVLEPGRTLSLMDCGKGLKDGWGYLDPNSGLYIPVGDSPIEPRFKEALRKLNPHLKRKMK